MIKKKYIFIALFILFSMLFVNNSYAVIEQVEDENIFQNTPAVIIEDRGIE